MNTLHKFLKDAWVEDMPPSIPNFQMADHMVPRKHQINGLNLALCYPKFGLFDSAGTGKTLTMQGYALYYIGWGNKVVVLMPPILLPQFRDSLFGTFVGSSESMKTWVLTQGPAAREKLFHTWDRTDGWPDMLLMSYELFAKVNERLKKNDYSVVITDEAQKLKGAESNIHAIVYNYTSSDANTCLLLATGTPIHHTLIDAYAMTRLINRKAYGNFAQFERLHCRYKSYRIPKRIRGRIRMIRVKELLGFKNEGTLKSCLYAHARRVTKNQVLDLKGPTIVRTPVELNVNHMRLYNKIANTKMLELGDGQVITATQATQLREYMAQIVCSPQDFSEKTITNNLVEVTKELVSDIGTKSKVILYAHHNRTVETLADAFESLDPAIVYGGSRSSSVKNQRSVQRFKKDADCTMLIGHPKSVGVGLDLQEHCHYAIFVEPTSIHGDFSQAMDRVHRGGQKKAVIVYILEALKTIYPAAIEVMLDNNSLASKINSDREKFIDLLHGADDVGGAYAKVA